MMKPEAKTAGSLDYRANMSSLREEHTLSLISSLGVTFSLPTYQEWLEEGLTHPEAVNDYNRAGLCMARVDEELQLALGQQLVHYMSRALLASEYRNAQNAGCRPGQKKNRPNPLKKLFRDKHASAATEGHLVRENDKVLADLIRVDPLVLLKSFYVQDAVCRWTYAAKWGLPGLRRRAKALLERSFPSKPGSPSKCELDREKFLTAYRDLYEYVKCIIRCAKVVRTVEELAGYFRDASVLERSGLVLKDLFNKRFKAPAPSDVAVAYIADFCGLSKSRVTDLISEVRNELSTKTDG
jgi:hypothetical protein